MSIADIYDKDGNPITMEQFSELKFGGDMEYHRVGSDDIGPYWVSTVWLGMDHNFFGHGPPLIFETMVFLTAERDDPEHHGLREFDTHRWSTLEEAQKGHQDVCTLVRATYQGELDYEAERAENGHDSPK